MGVRDDVVAYCVDEALALRLALAAKPKPKGIPDDQRYATDADYPPDPPPPAPGAQGTALPWQGDPGAVSVAGGVT